MKIEEIKAHWKWVEGLLLAIMPLIQFFYITAMEHGAKHATEDKHK